MALIFLVVYSFCKIEVITVRMYISNTSALKVQWGSTFKKHDSESVFLIMLSRKVNDDTQS
ncbi:hypothetical protein IW16_00100 [Chryseobacterium vrystaatense]|uniref:Uncharacterized protein n=1 Tax=Chryseobacterium vrystaatense TaxID=307480 RepID=A0ABR4UQY9_9FLAO|nr:hypothetical protein IW16_00100 [Chryseobacterium vrystaatense]